MDNPIKISCDFDAGNIEVIKQESADNIQLAIRKDTSSDFFQWFHFRVQGTQNQSSSIHLVNASQSSYPGGWNNYRAMASYDRQEWFRVDTEYDGKQLTIHHQATQNSVYYAYFTPYSFERHLDLLAWAQQSESCHIDCLGESINGHDINRLIIGDEDTAQLKIWIIGRQHPGETMAEWFIEGVLQRLLNFDDPCSRRLLEKAVFYVVPNMNPDGSILGNLRTNAAGANLNREWATPSKDHSPEVLCVKQAMQETGVDMFLDIHGDEAIPHVFVAGCEGNPAYSPRLENLENQFKQSYLQASADFQTKQGYPLSPKGSANLTLACNQVGQLFDCLSFTIELPFKDNADLADNEFGWSTGRCMHIGNAVLQPILCVLDSLRSDKNLD